MESQTPSNQPETRVDSILDRINSLNTVFEQAEKVCAGEIVEFLDEKQTEVKLYTEVRPEKVIELEIMIDDFKFVRETLKETVENGRKVINTLTFELMDADDSSRSALITSFAELVSSVNQSVKLLSQSYKDIANVLESMEKIRKSQIIPGSGKQNETGKNNSTVNIDKMVITTQETTADIISRLRLGNTND